MDSGMAKKGIVIVGMLLIFYGLINFAALFWYIDSIVKHDIYFQPFQSMIMILIFNAALLIAGAGIIDFKKWANGMGIVLVTIFAVLRLIYVIEYCLRYCEFGMINIPASISIQVLISIVIVFFLNVPKVKEQFK